MEEVKGYLDGERDYLNLKGGTGPLVYVSYSHTQTPLHSSSNQLFSMLINLHANNSFLKYRYPAGFVYLYSVLYRVMCYAPCH